MLINKIFEFVSEISENKQAHKFSSSDVASYLSDEKHFTEEEITNALMQYSKNNKEGNQAFFRFDEITKEWSINQSSSSDLRIAISEISRKEGEPQFRGSDLYKKLLISNLLKPGDFLERKSRNHELWFKQNVGNAFRKSIKDEKKYGFSVVKSKIKKENYIIHNSLIDGFDVLPNKALVISDKSLNKINNRKPLKKETTTYTYERNEWVKKQSKVLANYQCAFSCNMDKLSFKNKKGVYYTEAHHLIPMSAQDKFVNNNIDKTDNMLVLCPKHHREIHHANNPDQHILLKKAYSILSKNDWFKKTVPTFEQLLELY